MSITIVDLNTKKKKKKNPPKPVNPSTSDVKQRHKRKGGVSPPHSSRGRIGTATIKKKVDAAARRANERSKKAIRNDNLITELGGYFIPGVAAGGASRAKNKIPRPKTKPKSPKVPTIGGASRVVKRRPTMEEQRQAGASVIIDYDQIPESKKYGGKITYKMAGGQVVDSSYD